MRQLSATLVSDGMFHLIVSHIGQAQSIRNKKRFDPNVIEEDGKREPEKHPATLLEMRTRFNSECARLGLPEALPIQREDDRPYYWFKCDVDVFFREEEQ